MSLSCIFLSPAFKMSSKLSESDSNSVPPKISPISVSFESKSSRGMTFLDLHLTIKILLLSIARLDP